MSAQAKDLTGKRFGKLTVIKRVEDKIYKSGLKSTCWLCKCDCGNEVKVATGSLNQKRVGCRLCGNKSHAEKIAKHGLSDTRLYDTWFGMIRRCYNKKYKDYKNYGGRGITVCDEWENDFMVFHDWAISTGYRDDLTIDRIDVSGNYCPENCKWATRKEQNRNTRRNVFITINGDRRCITEWAKILNVSRFKLSRIFIKNRGNVLS